MTIFILHRVEGPFYPSLPLRAHLCPYPSLPLRAPAQTLSPQIALSYLRFKDDPRLDSELKTIVEAWMLRVARIHVQSFYEVLLDRDVMASNHLYWAGEREFVHTLQSHRGNGYICGSAYKASVVAKGAYKSTS